VRAYATQDDLAAYLGAAVPDDAERLLARASDLIDAHVVTPYDVDDEGVPVDPDLAAACSKATCAVIEAWLETGEANDIDGLAGTQYTLAGYSGQRAPKLPPRAKRILRDAGLTTFNPAAFW
jgi:hypothetical protein